MSDYLGVHKREGASGTSQSAHENLHSSLTRCFGTRDQIEGSQPEWCISSIYSRDNNNIIIIINLIYIAQFDTNGIFTALYIVITYI